MAALVVRSGKRKSRTECISYGLMDETDRVRRQYFEDKIWKDDATCLNMLRLGRGPFFRFCQLLRDRRLLQDTIHMSVEQQVGTFLHTVGHNVRDTPAGDDFRITGEVVSRYFKKVIHAIGELRHELIRGPSLATPTKIEGNHQWDPYFKDCVGVIDGTHVRASVTEDMEPRCRGRKTHATQNVMAAVDFDLRFTFVLAGWEGSAHDAQVLRDALERQNGLRVPQGKFYLVGAGHGAKPGFLPPFRGVRSHLNEWGNNLVQDEKELFNHRHSSLRTTAKRAFGSLKGRFKILDEAKPFFSYPTQVDIVIACCTVHNWVINDGIDEFIIPEAECVANINHAPTTSAQPNGLANMVSFRQGIANQMWEDRQNYLQHSSM
ncbi:hypothetical protein ACQJBY_063043 [Aegilops geniculata]